MTEEQVFIEAFDAFAQAVRRSRGATTGADGLSLSQYGLLAPLLEQDGVRLADLAGAGGVAAPTATRIVDGLERRGIVTRRRDSEDRRTVTVALTVDGRERVEAHRDWLRSRQRAFAATLTPTERAILPSVLLGLADLIDTLAAGPAE